MDVMPLNKGWKIPGIEFGEVLGRGGFGAVYRGRHQMLEIEVAIKIIDGGVTDPSVLDRALYEARLMARLDHPNLLRIYDVGRLGSAIYLVLEIMDDSCARMRLAKADLALDLTRQLLSALQALHSARILHRDIKPANCLVRSRDGRVKLADLGIAVEQVTRADKAYDSAGTMPFMAPELFDDPPRFSFVSDLYALGLTLACMFLETDPFPTGSISELLGWVARSTRPKLTSLRPDLPPALATLVDRMISPRIEDRPADAAEAMSLLGLAAPIAVAGNMVAGAEAATIGPWLLGSKVYESLNWHSYVVTHYRTGVAARLSHLQPGGPLANSTDLILSSAERASRFDHPGLLDLIDWGVRDDRAYVVTAPQGCTIYDLVKSGGPCEELEAVEFGLAIADALAYLHGLGLVYQIVDPGSVVITPDARSAQLSWPMFCVPVGTPAMDSDGRTKRVLVPHYAAPEALFMGESDTIEASVDLYGLGEVLYYLLAGRTSCRPGTAEALGGEKLQRKEVRAIAPAVTAPTARLVAELLEPDSANRPASALAVRDELARVARRLRGAAKVRGHYESTEIVQ